MQKLLNYLDSSKTAYQAVAIASKLLEQNGFVRLEETSLWDVKLGGKYFAVRDGSALIAFRLGKDFSFTIAASHTDSPCLKLKLNAENQSAGCTRLNVERYGGGLNYSFLDIPLSLAGRAIIKTESGVSAKDVVLDESFVIPSLAIHMNRNANDGLKLNPQVDLQILSSLGGEERLLKAIEEKAGGEVLDCDIYAVPNQKPFLCGFDDAFACSPRVDNLASAYASIEGIISATPKAVAMVYLADNEEVGSRTKQGAGSTFLRDVVKRISLCLNKTEEELQVALGNSFMLSCDNSHAVHPNHPELSDAQNKTCLGGGIAIKHHANQNYTTDGLSSATVKYVFEQAGVKYQDFFMRSDLPCGGTLGAISSAQLSIRSVDIGMPQLAMHASAETFAVCDYAEYLKGITAVLSTSFTNPTHADVIIK